jgi:hypothetical protein
MNIAQYTIRLNAFSQTRLTISVFSSYGLLVALILTACIGVTNPSLPAGAIAMQPPKPYALWWNLTEACSGITGDFASVSWYVLPNQTQFEVNARKYQSYWFARGNAIVITASSRLDGQLVRHEMLHALAGPEHRQEYFVDKCGGVVVCESSCLAEAGELPTPPTNSPIVQSIDLDTELRVDPADASLAKDSGWIALTVSIANLREYPVWTRLLPVSEGAVSAATFGYILDCRSVCGGWSEYKYFKRDSIALGARQTRRFVFDRQLSVGEYSIRGFFNSDTTAAHTFKVVP